MRIVVADDSAVMRKIVIRTLRQAGYGDAMIAEAADGEELVDIAVNDDPDLVLSDWNMPVMNGIEALRAIRAAGCGVPFGFVTSEGSDVMRQTAAEAGANFLIVKPFNADAFAAALGGHAAVAAPAAPVPVGTQMTLPAPKLLKDTLDGLLGKDVQLAPRSKPLTSIDAVGGAIALYVDDRNRTRAVLGWDVSAAAYAGCAFGLVPVTMATSIVKEKWLPKETVDSVYELSNVLSAALIDAGNPHVKLSTLYHPAAAAPTDIAKALYAHYERMDFDIDVAGYGTGLFSVVVLG
jgi:CheY-like chemotaxis protein